MTHKTLSTISSLRGAQVKSEVELDSLCRLLDAQVAFPEIEICSESCGACVGKICAMDGQIAPIGKPCRASNKEAF